VLSRPEESFDQKRRISNIPAEISQKKSKSEKEANSALTAISNISSRSGMFDDPKYDF
jgi:hypothetical protein